MSLFSSDLVVGVNDQCGSACDKAPAKVPVPDGLAEGARAIGPRLHVGDWTPDGANEPRAKPGEGQPRHRRSAANRSARRDEKLDVSRPLLAMMARLNGEQTTHILRICGVMTRFSESEIRHE